MAQRRRHAAYGLARQRLPKAEVAAVTAPFVQAVGLSRFAAKYPGQLSGGMQQRVAIARVLARRLPAAGPGAAAGHRVLRVDLPAGRRVR